VSVSDKADRVLEVLSRREWPAHRHGRDKATGKEVIAVVAQSQLWQPAAFVQESERILRTLQEAGITASLIAIDSAPSRSQEETPWVVIRSEPGANPGRWIYRRLVAENPKRWVRSRARLAAAFFGVGARVFAADRDSAIIRAHAVHPGTSVLPLSPLASQSEPKNGGRPDPFDVAAIRIVMPVALLAGLYGSAYPEWSHAIGLVVAMVLAVVAVSYGSYTDSIGRLLRAYAISGIGLLFAVALSRIYSEPAEATRQFLVACLLLLGGVGVAVEWRVRRLGGSLQWALPFAVSLMSAFVVAMGSLSYWAYGVELGLPYGSLDTDVWANVAAGVLPVFSAALLLYLVIGLYGLIRWLSGTAEGSGVFIGLVALLAASSAVLLALGDAVESVGELARSVDQEDDLPSFYLVEPSYVCVEATPEATVEGGPLVPGGDPWVLLGEFKERYVLWRSVSEYRRLAVNDASVSPADTDTPCPSDPVPGGTD
jgi:hypothetical protein